MVKKELRRACVARMREQIGIAAAKAHLLKLLQLFGHLRQTWDAQSIFALPFNLMQMGKNRLGMWAGHRP
jgi:hypothetical protein